MADATVIVTLTEIPQANLIEVMETDGSSNTVDQDGIGNGDRNDIGEIDFEEIGIPYDRTIGDIADYHEE